MQAVEHDGTKRDAEPFDKDNMEKLLDDPKVKKVEVFKLIPGMTLVIGGYRYKVTAARPNGKYTLRLMGGINA